MTDLRTERARIRYEVRVQVALRGLHGRLEAITPQGSVLWRFAVAERNKITRALINGRAIGPLTSKAPTRAARKGSK